MNFQRCLRHLGWRVVSDRILNEEGRAFSSVCWAVTPVTSVIWNAKPVRWMKNNVEHIEKSIPGPTNETSQKPEAEAAGLDEKIRALEGNMLEFLLCPVALCAHNFKYNKNNKKRTAEPIIRPSKLTAKTNDNKLDDEDFKIPRKTAKSNTVPKKNIKINSTKNKFAALNTANDDVEDVTIAAPKVKPVMMKLFQEYNLILQDIHRTHPTVTNTHVGGYIKIQAESADQHREITQFLTDKAVQYYVTDPPKIDHSN
ncbi:uncharacterized protein TNCV_553891 [Trichonephila clavipes]|nr:uncharacterized protein TNCV_553891 [Trichonephila clavipes]